MRTKVGQIALLAVALGAMGWCTARLIALVAAITPNLGWSWLIALPAGIALTAGPPAALAYGLRHRANWVRWLLPGYVGALVIGMGYYLPRRFTPPPRAPANQPVPAPPLSFDLQVASLLAVTTTLTIVTLLILLTAAETIAPGRAGPWMRAMLRRPPDPAP